MANYKNSVVKTITTLTTIPDAYQVKSGTLTTKGVFVTGDPNTKFLSEIGGGDLSSGGTATLVMKDRTWLFNGSNEIRKIMAVVDDQHMVLEEAFTFDIVAAATVNIVPASRAMQMSYLALAAGGIVDGNTLQNGEFGGFGETGDQSTSVVDPLIVDGSGGQIRVNIYYFN